MHVELERVADGFRAEYPVDGAVLTCTHLSGDEHRLWAELRIEDLFGTLLHFGRVNLLAGTWRRQLAQSLAKQRDADWAAILEDFSLRVVDAWRAEQAASGGRARAYLLNLAQVPPARLRWLWPGRLPLGKLAILDGLPGVGKSLVQVDIIARLTTGRPMPDGTQPELDGPGNVVVVTAEDDLADTLVPRLLAAGADLKRVVALHGVLEPTERGPEERWWTLKDIAVLREAVLDTRAVLVTLDPLAAFIAARMAYDEEVRERLGPLARLAEEAGAVVWAVRHLNKQVGLTDPVLRGGGSIGIIGAARAGLLVGLDPDDPEGERRVLAVVKTNLTRRVPSLAFRVVAPEGVPVVEWLGYSEHSARSLLAGQAEEPTERAALAEAVEFLAQVLAQGPRPAQEVIREAARAGFSERTLRRAKAAARVVSRRQGDTWAWALPGPDRPGPQVDHPVKIANHTEFGNLGNLDPLEGLEPSQEAGSGKAANIANPRGFGNVANPPPFGNVAKGESLAALAKPSQDAGFSLKVAKIANIATGGSLGNLPPGPPPGPEAQPADCPRPDASPGLEALTASPDLPRPAAQDLGEALGEYRAHVEACGRCSRTQGPRCEEGHALRRAYHTRWAAALEAGTLDRGPGGVSPRRVRQVLAETPGVRKAEAGGQGRSDEALWTIEEGQ